MREIKFRAWVTYYDEAFMLNLDMVKNKYDFENGFVLAFVEDAYEGFSCHELMSQEPDLIIMQYTGLRDKNGVEIYEGDVVSILDKTTRKKPFIGEVKWNGIIAGFEAFPKGQEWGMFLHGHPMLTAEIIPELQKFIGNDKTQGRTIEVIGNIYENKDLL